MSILRHVTPAVAQSSVAEAGRAGIGAFVGLGIAGLFVLSPAVDRDLGLYLVAPFGASSVLLFALPNSPLAQPWSAVVGNVLAALIGVLCAMFIEHGVARVALAVGATITATILAKALHPPAGAVAMTAALAPENVDALGFWFVLSPVALGTVLLVILAMGYAKLTGRHYPFRRVEEADSDGTNDAGSSGRLGLSESELTNILEQYKQSFNLGAEDLARLIGAAELQAAAHHTGPLCAGDIMSSHLVSVSRTTPLNEIADQFARHRFTSLPVVQEDGRYLGIIFQIHLITRAREDALRLNRGFASAFRRLVERGRLKPVEAQDIMSVAAPRAQATTPLSVLLSLVAEAEIDAVPVLDGPNLIGIVTRTDLVRALSRQAIRSSK
ncbi:HPP family protein [Roseivivax sp. CAU 1761]